MLFEVRFRDAVQDGSVTITFRRWKRCQAIAGHRYRTAVGMIEVEQVDVVDPAKITNADAKRSGYPSADAVRADLRGTDDLPVYRIRFHAVHEADPRDELAATDALSVEEVAEITKRLDRLDPRARRGRGRGRRWRSSRRARRCAPATWPTRSVGSARRSSSTSAS